MELTKFKPARRKPWPVFTQPLEAVIFDLDGTLRFSRPSFNGMFIEQAAALGVKIEPAARHALTRWSHSYWAQSVELLQDVEVFAGDEDGFWANYAQRVLSCLGCAAPQLENLTPIIHLKMTTEHQPENWIPPETHAILNGLRQAGLRLGLLTNRSHPVTDDLEAWGLSGYFELALAAVEVSAWKPDPLVFKHFLERMGARPTTSLYVGDNYYADIVGAQRAGLQAVLLDPEGVFPEVDCPVIKNLSELLDMI